MSQFKPNHEHDPRGYQKQMDVLLSIQAELQKETDRGVAILAAAMLDEKLKTILSNFLIQGVQSDALLKGSNAPIGTFSAKLNMAFAVGLISSDEYHDAEIIRRIRNDFAHKFDFAFSFENQSVAARCNNFLNKKHGLEGQNPRTLFVVTAAFLAYSLMFRDQHAQTLRLTPHDWKAVLFPKERTDNSSDAEELESI